MTNCIPLNLNFKKILEASEYLIDRQVGIVKEIKEYIREPADPPLFCYFAKACNTAAFCEEMNFNNTGGVSTNKDIALAKAIGEAIERYSAAIYSKEDFPFTTKRNAPFPCVETYLFNLNSEEQYQSPNFPISPFHDNVPVRWVPAVELGVQDICYVPAQAVYIPYTVNREEPLIGQVISTGLACHGTFEDAALSAICEVIERDAFNITWQAGITPPSINIETLPIANHSLVEQLSMPGCQLDLFDITLDSGVCTILSTMRFSKSNAPALVVATASDLNPETAIRKSLEELAHTRRYSQYILDHVPPLTKEHSYIDIASEIDHLHFWCYHHHLPLASFLFASTKTVNFYDLPNLDTNSSIQNLNVLRDQITKTGHRIFLVDVTPSDIQSLGLTVIRALIPGYHPLRLGHWIRALGGERLWNIPQKFGYAGVNRKNGDINIPHPFP